MTILPHLLERSAEVLHRIGQAALGLLYPPHCALCLGETPPGCQLCAECAGQARRIVPPFCAGCSEPFSGALTGAFRCADCRQRGFHFSCAVAPYRASGVVRECIHRFKYQRQYHLRHPLAEWLAVGLADERLQNPAPEIIVPVPLHSARQREREFNQAEVLSRLLAQHCGLPVVRALRRTRYTETQTQLDREGRMQNLSGAFSLHHSAAVTGRHLLLIDDVFTTGSTVEECSRVLRRGGVASVRVLTVARAARHF